MASYWFRVAAELEARGHEAVAVDLPGDDESAGLPEYADIVVEAVGNSDDAVLVAQSLGGFTAPIAGIRAPVRELVLLNAMIPVPGETAGEWWANTGAQEARMDAARSGGYPLEFDAEHYFFHDVAPDVLLGSEGQLREETAIVFTQPCPIELWPEVPTRVLVGRDDRFFPASFQRRVARERLGKDIAVVPGGHLLALSRPVEFVEVLLGAENSSLPDASP